MSWCRGLLCKGHDNAVVKHWILRVVMMPTLSWLVAPPVAIRTSDHKVGIMTSLGFQLILDNWMHVAVCLCYVIPSVITFTSVIPSVITFTSVCLFLWQNAIIMNYSSLQHAFRLLYCEDKSALCASHKLIIHMVLGESYLIKALIMGKKISSVFVVKNCWKISGYFAITHCGLVTSYGARNISQHWLR